MKTKNEVSQAAGVHDVASVETTNDRLHAGLAGRDSVDTKKKKKKKKKAVEVAQQIDDLSWADHNPEGNAVITAPIIGESVASKFLESIGVYTSDGFSLRNLKDRVVTYWEQTAYLIKLYEDIKVVKIMSEKDFGAYVVREEMWDDGFEGPPVKMTAAYSSYDNSYIGEVEFAEMLVKNGISKIQRKSKDLDVATIGYSEDKSAWAGWSHRAICLFGIGDKVFDEKYYDTLPETTPFKKGGTVTIKTMDQAKQAAINFSDYVA